MTRESIFPYSVRASGMSEAGKYSQRVGRRSSDPMLWVMTGWLPPPEIPIEIVYTAINSILGPDDIRGDFLRDLLGHQPEEEAIGGVFRRFVQLLTDGEAPPQFWAFLGGGRLVGVGKIDAEGNRVSLESDARPIVLKLVWRKIVFKCTFSLDRSGIRERLGDK